MLKLVMDFHWLSNICTTDKPTDSPEKVGMEWCIFIR